MNQSNKTQFWAEIIEQQNQSELSIRHSAANLGINSLIESTE